MTPPPAAVAAALGGDITLVRPLPVWRRLARRPVFVAGFAILAVIAVASLLAPLLTPYDPIQNDLRNAGQLPSLEHWLGTDALGRDVLTRLLYGGVDALTGALFCVLVAAVIGIPTGIIAGYRGGLADSAGSLIGNLMQALPGVVVMLMAVSIFGTGIYVGMGVLGILLSAGFFRLARNGAQAVRRDLFVDAARAAGLRGPAIMGRHVLPNVARPLVIQASLTATVALLLQAGLAFLGQGTPPPYPSWGGMVKEATDVMTRFPWLMVPSGVTIALAALAFNMLGDGLSDDALPAGTVPRALRASRSPGARVAAGEPGAGAAATDAAASPLLSVQDLTVAVTGRDGQATVLVDGVSLEVKAGEAIALVGESGCGKSITALAIVGLLPASVAATRGRVDFEGEDLLGTGEAGLASVRGTGIGFVSQDPIASLDPSFTIGSQIAEPLRRHRRLSSRAAREQALELLRMVEISDPASVANRYPHQVSGGMAQRVAIAIALTGNPRLLIADEPTTALDVTVQAEILQLLRDLQGQTGVGLLLVTHDWGVVADIATRAVVMYAGQVAEQAAIGELFARASHPYTLGLLRSVPRADQAGLALPAIPGSVPPPGTWPAGCHFQNRCGLVIDACREGPIELRTVAPDHLARCIRDDARQLAVPETGAVA